MTEKDDKLQASTAHSIGHNSIGSAILSGIVDLFSKKNTVAEVPEDVRIDGKICLVTGANSGLGKAVAKQLADRGGKIIMACRSDSKAAKEEIIRETHNTDVEVIQVDLSDLASVKSFVETLKQKNIKLDIIVFNAGLMPLSARKSAQGYEVMFAVHFLANRYMMKLIEENQLLNKEAEEIPRLVFVSSDTHRSAEPIDFDNFGAFHEYGIKDGIKYYGQSKLYLSTFARELSRRLNKDENKPAVAVHSLCPGPVASNITRESPGFLTLILKPIMKTLFQAPDKAAAPVIYLCCAPEMGEKTNIYMHLMQPKPAGALATDEENGKSLWQASELLINAFENA